MKNTLSSEYAVIGYMLRDPASAPRFTDVISPTDFTNPHLRQLYEMAQADPARFDMAAAANSLSTVMDTQNTMELLHRAEEMAAHGVSSALNHAEGMRDAAMERDIRERTDHILRESDGAIPIAEALVGVGQSALSREISGQKTIAKSLADYLKGIEERNTGRVDTGFPRLDALLKGLLPGNLAILGARPSCGKSAFALNVAANVACNFGKVLLFTLEMSADEVSERLMVYYGSCSLDDLADNLTPTDAQMHDIAEAAGLASNLPIVVDDRAGLSVEQLRARARMHPDAKLIIVDYLQLMQTPRRENRTNEISALTRELKILAGELKIPMLVLSQLNRGKGENDRPELRSLRDSGSIEQDANKVLLMWKTKMGLTAVDVAKNRRGKTGVIQYLFNGSHMNFMETDEPYVEKGEGPRAIRPVISD